MFSLLGSFVNWYISQLIDLNKISYSFSVEDFIFLVKKFNGKQIMVKKFDFDSDEYTIDYILSTIHEFNSFE